ncbi:alpha/beta hydrolase [Kocuria coralli]|nr:alpha/beta hydrolase-fold protein [Kocuria coralli]
MLSITGMPVLIVSFVLFVVMLAVALVVLPRRRRPGLRKYVEQAVTILLVVFLALSTTFLYLNRDNHWYGAWGDLFANNDIGAVSTTDFGSAVAQNASYKETTGGDLTDLQRDPQSNPALGEVSSKDSTGQWLNVTMAPSSGSKTQLSVDALVWLPPGYVGTPDRSYPVVVAFPGVPGSPGTYQNGLRIDDLILDNVDSGSMQAPIVVVPDVFPDNADTECVDGAAGKWETWISTDMRTWITTNLRTVPDRQAWAVSGYSAGGWCAAMISLRHPDQYAWGISLAGYFDVEYTPGQVQNDPDDPRYQLDQLAGKKKPDVALWAFAGGQDQPALDALHGFQSHVSAPTSLIATTSEAGGHRTPVWVTPQQDSLKWLGQVSPWFAADGS